MKPDPVCDMCDSTDEVESIPITWATLPPTPTRFERVTGDEPEAPTHVLLCAECWLDVQAEEDELAYDRWGTPL